MKIDHKSALFLSFFFLIPGTIPGQANKGGLLQDPVVTWTVTVVGAKGLRDLDILPSRKTSDPYVVVIQRQSIFPDGIFRIAFVPVGKTPVVQDSTSPTWNYTCTVKEKLKDHGPWLVFRVWDKDPHSSAFLGVAKWSGGKPGVYHLPLKRTLAGTRRVPGELTVQIQKSEPVVTVPSVTGLTLEAAGTLLRRNGLFSRFEARYTVSPYNSSYKPKVESQDPAPGTKVAFRSIVKLVYALPYTMHLPDLKGMTRRRVERLIPEPFRKNLHFKIRRSREKDTDKWFKVCDQDPRPTPFHSRIDAVHPIWVYILEPAKGTRVEVPKVTGKNFREARRILDQHYIHNIKFVTREHPTLNRVVLSQSPPAGTLYPYDEPAGVTLTVAALADGRSILTAKSLKPGPPFTCVFSRKKRHEYRKIQIHKTGYLVARVLKTTGGQGVDIRFFSPSFEEKGIPPAVRVTPGTWYVDFSSRVRGLARKAARLQVEFVPEFDPGEPNDTRETARTLQFPAHLTFGICGPKDRDHYRFELKKPAYLEIRGGKDVGSDKCPVGIRTTLVNEKDKVFYSGPLDCLKWLPAGAYDLEIWGEEEGFDTRPHTVDLRLQEDLDKTEPNDTIDEATLVRVPAYTATRFETRGSDYFHLVSKEPGFVIISTEGSELPAAVICDVLDSRGNKILPHEQLPRALRIDKDAYVNLGLECEKDDERQAPVVLHFAFIPLKADPLEPNDSPGSARPVPTDTPLTALLLPAEDRDFYKFTISRDQEVTFEILKSPKEHFTCVGHLFDSAGKEITGDRRIYFPRKYKLKKGTYTIELEMEGGMRFLQTAPYVFRIKTALGKPAPQDPTGEKKLEDRYRTGQDRNGGKSVEDAIALAARAYRLLQKGEPAKALLLYAKAAKGIPRSPAVWNDMGVCCYKLNKFPLAERLFKKALSLKADYTLAFRNLAVLANRLGDPEGAVSWCAKAAAANPSAKNLSFLGHFQLLAAARSKDRAKKKALLLESLKNLEKSFSLEKDPKVAAQVRLIQKALGRK